MTTDRRAELETAIAVDPNARDNYIVYGDWLESIGDPRGALVTIGAAPPVVRTTMISTSSALPGSRDRQARDDS